MLIDVHAHMDFPAYDADRNNVLSRALEEGVCVITSAIGTAAIEKTLGFLDGYENLYASFGLAPTELDEKEIEGVVRLIEDNRDRIVALGEVGLDYYWIKEEEERRREKENFSRFIETAKKLSLPLVIHSRDAVDDVLDALEKNGIKALMHCFGGDAKQVERAVCAGHLVSIPTNLVNSKKRQAIAKEIPLESIVLETDAPYLAPVPKTRNEPSNVRVTCEKIAQLKGLSFDEVARATTENAKRFFSLSL